MAINQIDSFWHRIWAPDRAMCNNSRTYNTLGLPSHCGMQSQKSRALFHYLSLAIIGYWRVDVIMLGVVGTIAVLNKDFLTSIDITIL